MELSRACALLSIATFSYMPVSHPGEAMAQSCRTGIIENQWRGTYCLECELHKDS